MDKYEALKMFKKAVAESGGQAQFATRIGVSRMYINDVYCGRRSLGPKVLKELGLVAVTTTHYEREGK